MRRTVVSTLFAPRRLSAVGGARRLLNATGAAVDDLEQRQLESFRIFNDHSGKFRVAVVNRCNMDCFFCHNEGMDNPRRSAAPLGAADPLSGGGGHQPAVNGAAAKKRDPLKRKGPSVLSTEQLLGIMNAFTRLGGKQINVTGGEPLAHPEINAILRGIDKRNTRVVLNSNVLLAQRLLKEPKIDNVDAIYASLHTTSPQDFREKLGTAASAARSVMDNMVLLKRHGYRVQINYSLGDYNKAEFARVLDFAVAQGIDLKAIALIRPNDDPQFYGGEWINPQWVERVVDEQHGLRRVAQREGFGGRTTTWQQQQQGGQGAMTVEIKNVATGRLITDYCKGCRYVKQCGEGIYALRSGVDGLWKPCLLNQDKFARIEGEEQRSYRDQILHHIHSMVGDWSKAQFSTGAPM